MDLAEFAKRYHGRCVPHATSTDRSGILRMRHIRTGRNPSLWQYHLRTRRARNRPLHAEGANKLKELFMASIASAKMPVVFPRVWVGKSSDVPEEIRKNGIPFKINAPEPAAMRCPLQGNRACLQHRRNSR